MANDGAEHAWIFEPGDVINGRFEVTQRLGYGGIGEVYEVEHSGLYMPVALKILRAQYARRAGTVKMDREARLGAHIRRHCGGRPGADSFVLVFDSGTTDGKDATGAERLPKLPFFTMERLDGHTLHEYIRHRRQAGDPIRVIQVLRLVAELAKALGLLHDSQLIHCDLKPENVFISRIGERVVIKVLDLGMVAWPGDDERPPGIRCTPRYGAPEQLRGAAPTFATDVYALGAIVYEALTFRGPFDDGAVALGEREFFGVHAKKRVPPIRELRPDVPGPLDRLVLEMLEVDPSKRPSLATILDAVHGWVQRHGERSERGADLGDLATEIPKVLVDPARLAPANAPAPREPATSRAVLAASIASTRTKPAFEAGAVRARATVRGLGPSAALAIDREVDAPTADPDSGVRASPSRVQSVDPDMSRGDDVPPPASSVTPRGGRSAIAGSSTAGAPTLWTASPLRGEHVETVRPRRPVASDLPSGPSSPPARRVRRLLDEPVAVVRPAPAPRPVRRPPPRSRPTQGWALPLAVFFAVAVLGGVLVAVVVLRQPADRSPAAAAVHGAP